jgi:hypothetical protein
MDNERVSEFDGYSSRVYARLPLNLVPRHGNASCGRDPRTSAAVVPRYEILVQVVASARTSSVPHDANRGESVGFSVTDRGPRHPDIAFNLRARSGQLEFQMEELALRDWSHSLESQPAFAEVEEMPPLSGPKSA